MRQAVIPDTDALSELRLALAALSIARRHALAAQTALTGGRAGRAAGIADGITTLVSVNRRLMRVIDADADVSE